MKTTLLSLIFCSLFLVCTPAFAVDIKPIDLQIPIGGTSTITPCTETNKELTCDGLAKYMIVLYEFLIRAAAILAVLMLVWGGVQWLSAAGESKRVGEAQKVIQNALIGLILALGSHTLLWSINPNLVDLGKLKLALIDKKDLSATTAPSLFTLPAPAPTPPPPILPQQQPIGNPTPQPAPDPNTPPPQLVKKTCLALTIAMTENTTTILEGKDKMTKTECEHIDRNDFSVPLSNQNQQIKARAWCDDGVSMGFDASDSNGWKNLPTGCTAV